ncbi:hypothetical protein [Polyangium sp. 15x6]|uniref:hypothetical protein n=1 Tax=Polyangium sp. 15x6 TaxID=3042687 RepID=UPI00249B27BB|nr:hypothetical protein [Polyangium sp. 15x6]MDI3289551.1 hypothetical protein [Polyangium sp. 15x6]
MKRTHHQRSVAAAASSRAILFAGTAAAILTACLSLDTSKPPSASTSSTSSSSVGGSGGAGGMGGAGGTGGTATGDVLWGKAFGAQFGDQHASGVALDPTDDSIFLVGNYEGQFSFDGLEELPHSGLEDIYLAKFDATGAAQWAIRSGDQDAQYVNAVAVSADRDIFLAGSFQGELTLLNGVKLMSTGGKSDVFAVRLTPEGVPVWAKGFGDGSTMPKLATTLAVDSKGNTIIAGYFDGSLEFIPGQPLNAMGGRDIFLAKLDKDGNTLWSKRLGNGSPGDPPNHLLCRVVVDHLDNIVLETAFSGTMSLGAPLPDQASPGNRAILLAKFDTNGAPLWQKVFGAAYTEQRSRALAVDSKNNILLTGDMAGTVNFGGEPLSTSSNSDPDLFVAKFAPNGEHLWSLRSGSVTSQEGKAIAVDAADNVIVTGSFLGVLSFGVGEPLVNIQGGYDLFALKLDPNGAFLWAKQFGDGAAQVTEAMAIDREGNTIFAGSFDGRISFGATELSSAGYDDIFVMKLSP